MWKNAIVRPLFAEEMPIVVTNLNEIDFNDTMCKGKSTRGTESPTARSIRPTGASLDLDGSDSEASTTNCFILGNLMPFGTCIRPAAEFNATQKDAASNSGHEGHKRKATLCHSDTMHVLHQAKISVGTDATVDTTQSMSSDSSSSSLSGFFIDSQDVVQFNNIATVDYDTFSAELKSAVHDCVSRGAMKEALQVYDNALPGIIHDLGGNHPFVAQILRSMGVLCMKGGCHDDALLFLGRALNVYYHQPFPQKSEGSVAHPLLPHQEEIAETYYEIGSVYMSKGVYGEHTIWYFKRSLKLRTELYGSLDPYVARTMVCIGTVHANMGRYAQAKQQYSKALHVQKQALGAQHLAVASTLNSIATVHEMNGRSWKALNRYRQAREIFIANLGHDHPIVKELGDIVQSLKSEEKTGGERR